MYCYLPCFVEIYPKISFDIRIICEIWKTDMCIRNRSFTSSWSGNRTTLPRIFFCFNILIYYFLRIGSHLLNEEVVNRKLNFLCSGEWLSSYLTHIWKILFSVNILHRLSNCLIILNICSERYDPLGTH